MGKLAKEPQVQVTAASAALGGAAFGAGGGIAGAVIGVVPAIFTFGLSIPVGAAIGATIGGTAGVVGGGAVGYGAYGKKTEIYNGVSKCVEYAKDKKDQVFGNKKAVDNAPMMSVKKSRPE